MLRFDAGTAIGASFCFPVLLSATEAENQTGFLLGVELVHCALLSAVVLSFSRYRSAHHHAVHALAHAHCEQCQSSFG